MRRVQGFGAGASVDKEVLLAQTSLLNKKTPDWVVFCLYRGYEKDIFVVI